MYQKKAAFAVGPKRKQESWRKRDGVASAANSRPLFTFYFPFLLRLDRIGIRFCARPPWPDLSRLRPPPQYSPFYSTVLLVPAAAVPSTRRASAYQSLPPCGVTRPCESENSINFATAVEPVDSARFLFACRSRIVTIRRAKMKTGRAFHFISW